MENLLGINGQNEIDSAEIVFYIDGEEPTIGGLQSTPSIPKKPRALVYQFFEWEQESSRYKCNLCEYANLFNVEVGFKLSPKNLINYRKTYAVPKSGGTGSLNNHMIRKHQGEFDNAKKAKNGESSSSNQEARNLQVPLNEDRISSEVFRHKLITFLVCCDEPFTLTENEYFKDLIEYTSGKNDECRLFSAKTTKGLITDLHSEYKSNSKAALQNNKGKISFVIDCWTSSNQYPFQGVIARWINDEWELCSTVLDLTILHGTHEGKNLANAFWEVLKEYDLFGKVLSVTTDNASNMDTLFEELEKLFSEIGIPFDSKNYRIRCFAHIMNLACQAMIYSVGDGPATEYPSDDSDDEDNEKASQKAKVLPVIAKMRKGVVSIRSSPQRRELLARQCIAAKIEPRVVLRDVRTRWNATHRMMERATDLKEPFDLTLRSIPKKRKYCLEETEWEKVKDLLALLEPFREATEMLSNEHSPTLSRVSAVYQALFDHLEKFKTIDRDQSQHQSKRVKRNTTITTMPSPWLSKAAEDGLAKLEKYYPSTDGLVHIVNTGKCKLLGICTYSQLQFRY